tara:strand:- start:310 stop:630 length:321 start_codon:yes stop_codon:yes gene_type:complete
MIPNNEPVTCQDGFRISVQASSCHYCSPREDNAESYATVELGYPSSPQPLIHSYAEDRNAPTQTVYSQVPVAIVRELLAKHGGIVSGGLPAGVYEDSKGQAVLDLD